MEAHASTERPDRRALAVLLGAFVGLTVGTGPVLSVSFALFVKPVTADLGWSRGFFSTAPLILAIAAITTQPLFGWLLDRFGVRRAVLPFVALMLAALLGLSRMDGSVAAFVLLYAVAGVASCAQAPPVYSKIVSLWFDRRRGLALAFATSGAAVGNILVPLFAGGVIAREGWRAAYAGLGLLNFAVAFLVVSTLLREPGGGAAAHAAAGERIARTGATLREALRSGRFWMLAAVFFLMALGMNGTLAHSVALLTDRGWSPQQAVRLLSAAGLANVCGRFFAGWLLDRTASPWLPALLLVVPAIGCLLLTAASPSWPYVAIPLLTFAYGAEIDVMAYLSGRYFGLRNFGQIYGLAFSAFALGAGVGPVLAGRTQDVFHSYGPALVVNAALLVLAAMLTSLLGPYRYTAAR